MTNARNDRFSRLVAERDFDAEDIKAEIKRHGHSLTSLAIEAGLSPQACRQGLIGNSRKGAEAIAAFLGFEFRELFPTQYSRGRHNEGKPSRTRPLNGRAKARAALDSERRSA